jgi:hypothetical protein
MMNHSIIKIENISNYTIEIIDDILIATKKGKTKKEYTEWTEELLLEKDIKNSSLSYCKLNDVVFKPKKWRLLVDKLYETINDNQFIVDNTTLKLLDETNKIGYEIIKNKIRTNNLDAKTSLIEIIKLCRLKDYKLEVKIKLQSNEIINFKL